MVADEDIAIALGYDIEKDPAPKVLASGKGEIARQIIKIAEENGIEIRTDKDLAQILSTLDVDQYIPLEAYTAVADILNYIYKKNNG